VAIRARTTSTLATATTRPARRSAVDGLDAQLRPGLPEHRGDQLRAVPGAVHRGQRRRYDPAAVAHHDNVSAQRSLDRADVAQPAGLGEPAHGLVMPTEHPRTGQPIALASPQQLPVSAAPGNADTVRDAQPCTADTRLVNGRACGAVLPDVALTPAAASYDRTAVPSVTRVAPAGEEIAAIFPGLANHSSCSMPSVEAVTVNTR
jgi:hypothetical protein